MVTIEYEERRNNQLNESRKLTHKSLSVNPNIVYDIILRNFIEYAVFNKLISEQCDNSVSWDVYKYSVYLSTGTNI